MAKPLKKLAGPTGLEPAISCVTGRRDNQLHYGPTSEWHRRPTGPRAGNEKLGLRFPPAKLSQVCAPDHPGIFHLPATHLRSDPLWNAVESCCREAFDKRNLGNFANHRSAAAISTRLRPACLAR